MKISVTIDHMVRNEQKIKAYASVTLADAFKIHGIRVLDGKDGLYVTMPQRSYTKKDIAYKDVTGAVREAMQQVVDRLEHISEPPEVIREKLLDLALELQSVSGKKQYGYLKKPLKDQVDAIVDELEKLPEVAEYYAVWNGLRDTLDGYYKSAPRQHHPLSQQKEFRAIKNAIVQEAELLRLQLEQNEAQACTGNLTCNEETASVSEEKKHLQSEILLTSTVRLFHQMSQIFCDNAAAPSNPMGIRTDSKRRKKLLQKRLALGHRQDDHEEMQNYGQSIS